MLRELDDEGRVSAVRFANTGRLGTALKDRSMLIVMLATAPNPMPLPSVIKVEFEGVDPRGPISLAMPSPGLATSQSLSAPRHAPTFEMKIRYYLDDRRVGVIVKGVGPNDSVNIFGCRQDKSPTGQPGMLYVGKIIHANQNLSRDCGVRCEHGTPTFEDCCVVCQDGNIVTETCC